MKEINKNTEVRMKSFLGTLTSKKKIAADENYWNLIGQKGKIIDNGEINEERVLVLFENDLDDYNVTNHNPVKNSLWIKKNDLEVDSESESD